MVYYTIVYWNTAKFAMLIAPQSSTTFSLWFYLIFYPDKHQAPSCPKSQLGAYFWLEFSNGHYLRFLWI